MNCAMISKLPEKQKRRNDQLMQYRTRECMSYKLRTFENKPSRTGHAGAVGGSDEHRRLLAFQLFVDFAVRTRLLHCTCSWSS